MGLTRLEKIVAVIGLSAGTIISSYLFTPKVNDSVKNPITSQIIQKKVSVEDIKVHPLRKRLYDEFKQKREFYTLSLDDFKRLTVEGKVSLKEDFKDNTFQKTEFQSSVPKYLTNLDSVVLGTVTRLKPIQNLGIENIDPSTEAKPKETLDFAKQFYESVSGFDFNGFTEPTFNGKPRISFLEKKDLNKNNPLEGQVSNHGFCSMDLFELDYRVKNYLDIANGPVFSVYSTVAHELGHTLCGQSEALMDELGAKAAELYFIEYALLVNPKFKDSVGSVRVYAEKAFSDFERFDENIRNDKTVKMYAESKRLLLALLDKGFSPSDIFTIASQNTESELNDYLLEN